MAVLNKQTIGPIMALTPLLFAAQACDSDNKPPPKTKQDREQQRANDQEFAKEIADIEALIKARKETARVDASMNSVVDKFTSITFIQGLIKGGKDNTKLKAEQKSFQKSIEECQQELKKTELSTVDRKYLQKTLEQAQTLKDVITLGLLFRRHYNAGSYPKLKEIREEFGSVPITKKRNSILIRFCASFLQLSQKRKDIYDDAKKELESVLRTLKPEKQ